MNKEMIFPIGIGTWKIDCDNIKNDIEGLKYSYEKGQNYLSLYWMYHNGAVVKSLKEYISELERDKIFININIEPTIEKVKT